MIKAIQDDITRVRADAIVNAANASLMGGGGVDGAIHRAGGPAILDACRQIVARQGGCPAGEAVITTAGKLPARYVIHTVGPVWHGGHHGEAQKLAACYRHSLGLARAHQCKSVAFPNISTGVYRFPKAEAAKIAVQTVREEMQHPGSLEEVIFVCYDRESLDLVRAELERTRDA